MQYIKWGAALIGAAMLASVSAAAQKTVENYKPGTDKELQAAHGLDARSGGRFPGRHAAGS